jgi:hypothetical protein
MGIRITEAVDLKKKKRKKKRKRPLDCPFDKLRVTARNK